MPITNKCIVLDLDETLVHTCEDINKLHELKIFNDPQFLDLRTRTYMLNIDDIVEPQGSGIKTYLWGITRPYLYEFLKFCFSYFEVVAIWSAGVPKYVDAIVNFIFKDLPSPHLVFSRNRCIKYSDTLTKPLQEMITFFNKENINGGMTLENTVLIDDRDDNFLFNPDNGILILPYSPLFDIVSMRENDICLLQLKYWFQQDLVIRSSSLQSLNKDYIFLNKININDLLLNNNINDEFINDLIKDNIFDIETKNILSNNNVISSIEKNWPSHIIEVS